MGPRLNDAERVPTANIGGVFGPLQWGRVSTTRNGGRVWVVGARFGLLQWGRVSTTRNGGTR